jgi:hypothetical protein
MIAGQLVQLRASSMPRAFLCAASIRQGDLLIDQTNEAGNNGTAAHKCLENLFSNNSIDWDAVEDTAKKYEADPEEVRMLCSLAVPLWRKIAPSFAGFRMTELEGTMLVEEGFPLLTGHLDGVATNGRVARALDWKTGRKDFDYSHQMKAYGTLVLLGNPSLEECTITIVWVRTGEIENYTMTQADAHAWVKELREKVLHWDGVYHPGSPQCDHCRRFHECEAARALARSYVATFTEAVVGRVEGDLSAMTPAEKLDLFNKAAFVGELSERVQRAIKSDVELNGDIVADGKRLTIATRNPRSVNVLAAWPILREEGFDDEDFAAVTKLSISNIEKRVKEKAGRGNGAAACRSLDVRLRNAGAITEHEVKYIEQKRA